MDCRGNYWFTRSWPPSSLSACNTALSLCMATHDMLLHTVIVLSIIIGILLPLSLTLWLRLYSSPQRAKEKPVLVKESTRTAESVTERPERPEKLSTSNITKNEEVPVLPSTVESDLPSSKSQLEVVGDAIEASPALPRTSSVASVHALSNDNQPESLRIEPDTVSHSSQRHPSPAPSLTVVSVDDFDEGQDDELHPEVRALVEQGHLTKEAVRRLKPIPPKAGTVIPGYNPVLDEARPETMVEYLHNYRIFFVIDDSRSMVRHWKETCKALSEIAEYALKYHSDAVDIRFFNSRYQKCGVRGTSQVMDIFYTVSPSAGTPTGRVLGEVLNEQLDRLDKAQRNGTYSSERPLDIIVLTDGVPNSNSPPAPVIEEAARRLKETGHHQNWVGIQFVQIGDDPHAGPTLLSLIDCANNHMVDTISYSFYKDEGGGRLTSQILERIILGGLHPNLRSYFNQFRRKLNERTAQVIY